ncbi:MULTISPECIES: hypothetical protein [Clostridium]|uniref:hypothetical protein n=1 Tax=Clostridium TaxID=1485 RepID=UPI0005C239A9|nr:MULTISPECIES: hypothetical protein [Clostridium]MDU4853433.1 hypothetical protein [Clostridioides difficile]KIU09082.1 hypothetical protein SC08_Contig83orf03138 [Clostridium butyricum]MBA8965408.1 hypothetical protein [Clostridium butyricum]MBA8970035.1 hypothetical protein [Clostridium butyricum]MBC2427670.1 hypothetical protein [Clostridium butyricum]
MTLEEIFKKYRELTLQIMDRVKIDGSIKYLLEKRGELLESIRKSDFSQDEIISAGKSTGIIELEKELNELVKNEQIDIKRKIKNLRTMHAANMQYTAIGYVPSNFNKKM